VCADCPSRLARDLEAAFPEFLAHHQDLVYGLALRTARHPQDAEDLAQETFIRAYRALKGYGRDRIEGLRSRGWLAAIVGNLGRDRGRRRRPMSAPLDDIVERADPDPGPDRVVAARESAQAWRARLETLPPRYRRAVELRHVMGLGYPEVAEALGHPVGTVKSDVHRGVRLLREAFLQEAAQDAGPAGPSGHREDMNAS
jgi:RNA polymerase sigma-70 factor (ECF subfamily)